MEAPVLAPPAEEEGTEVDVAVVDAGGGVTGGGVGAGVTFGVANGADSETYGSSMTLGCTMWSWLDAAPTMRDGVSSCATASSASRCALCSSDSWCCNEDKRT